MYGHSLLISLSSGLLHYLVHYWNFVFTITQLFVWDTMEKRILCVGLAAVDIVTVAEEYPDEDSETLAVDCFWRRGGNASNSSSVLAHLGANVEFLGTIVKNREQGFLVEDFKKCGVNIDNCIYLDEKEHKCPVCTLVISQKTGSRTALPNFRKITEVKLEDFRLLDMNIYSWIHFEGRPKSPDLVKMLEHVNQYNKTVEENKKIRTSVEIEQKPSVCPELQILFDKADVVFVSKDYAKEAGYQTKEAAVEGLMEACRPGSTVVCAWGENGAAAKLWGEETISSAAFPPENLIDTIAAGDTFNAAAIFAMKAGKSVAEAVTFACRVAGAKCGMMGTEGIKGMQNLL